MKKFFSKISYSILPFFIFVLTLLITYFGNQILTSLAEVGSFHYGTTWAKTGLDDLIPLVPEFIYVYYLTFPLGIVTFFYLAYKNKTKLYELFLTLVISFLISGIIYFFFQTRFIKPDFTAETFTEKLLVWTWNSTNPVNCFPSQHCFMAIAIFISCVSCKDMNIVYRIISSIIAILIVLATVFTKQHYWVDFLASLAIMLPTYLLIKFTKTGSKLENGFDKFYAKFSKKQENTNP